MKDVMHYNYLDNKIKLYKCNFKKIFRIKGLFELNSFDYDDNYFLWKKYDDFIKKVCDSRDITIANLNDIKFLKNNKKTFYDINLIKRINNKYKEIIDYIEKETGLVFGLDFV